MVILVITMIKLKCKRVTVCILSFEQQKHLKQNEQGKMNKPYLDMFHKSSHNVAVGTYFCRSTFSKKYIFRHWQCFDKSPCRVLYLKKTEQVTTFFKSVQIIVYLKNESVLALKISHEIGCIKKYQGKIYQVGTILDDQTTRIV